MVVFDASVKIYEMKCKTKFLCDHLFSKQI